MGIGNLRADVDIAHLRTRAPITDQAIAAGKWINSGHIAKHA